MEHSITFLKLKNMENQVTSMQGEKVVAILEEFKLFWNVSKQPLVVQDSHLNVIETDLYGIMRDDTKKVFTSVKEGYEVYQNWELVELLQKVASQTDLEIVNGGSFNAGGKIFLQMNSGSVKGIGENNDTVNKRLTAINSHDGSTSLSWGQTNVTVSCQNSFHLASKTLGNRVRHTASMRYKIEDALRQIDALREEEKSLFEKFFKMADMKATNQDVIRVVNAVSGVDINVTPTKASEMYHTRQNQ